MEYQLPEGFMDLGDDKPVLESTYDLVIETAEEKFAKESKAPMILCMIRIEGQPEAGLIFHNFMIPTDESKKFTNQMSKRFLQMFNVDYSTGFDVQKFLGCRASSAHVTLDTNQIGDIVNSFNMPVIQD